MASHYIGLMSGTSLDGVDAALMTFPPDRLVEIAACQTLPAPGELRHELIELTQQDANLSMSRLGELNQQLGDWFAEAALAVMKRDDIAPEDIAAIGSHGQTIWHQPDTATPFSMQLGSASRIAARTGCTVVADFRNGDMAVGGQGAPLVPAFHRGLFARADKARIVVNIGGIANLTILPAGADREETAVTGLDTGPGNALMDGWIQSQLGQALDAQGQWAASGTSHTELLDRMLQDPFLARRPPKSTGREYFNNRWLQAHIDSLDEAPTPADVQATLCEFTARSIAMAVQAYGPGHEEVLVCGGGAHNGRLMARLAELLAPRTVETTAAHGLSVDWIEAAAFAWLAKRRLDGLPGNLPNVTGARSAAVLGGIYAPPPGTN